MYIGKNGKGAYDPDQEQEAGAAPTNMKAQAARMAATVVPTTNMVSKPSSSSAPATGAPMARASSTPTTPPPVVAPTAPPNPAGSNDGRVAFGFDSGDPNYDNQARDIIHNLDSAKVDPAADKAIAEHQGQLDQANLEARMGAAGMGTSGALGAMTGDLKANLLRQLAQLDNQATTTNAGLQQNALNAIWGLRDREKQDAQNKAAQDAAITDAGGFLDNNHDGKDDATGQTEGSEQLSATLARTRTQMSSNNPMGFMNFASLGSTDKPYGMSASEYHMAKQMGWKEIGGWTGSFGSVIQDPTSGFWYQIDGRLT